MQLEVRTVAARPREAIADRDLRAQPLGSPRHNGETQTGALHIVTRAAPEALEHQWSIGWRDPWAIVGHTETGAVGSQLKAHLYAPATANIAQGVVEQVLQHRVQSHLVDVNRQLLGRGQRQRDAAVAREAGLLGQPVRTEVGEIEDGRSTRLVVVEAAARAAG